MKANPNKSIKLGAKNKLYWVEDPTDFILEFLTFQKKNLSHFPKDHWELTMDAFYGGMGAGKSEGMKYLAKLASEIYEEEFSCFQTNDLVYALHYLNEEDHIKDRKKVLFPFLDDAMQTGMDSRRSMSSANVEMCQDTAIIRHLLGNKDRLGIPDPRVTNGFCNLCYAIQSPTRLDKFIRENLHLAIYKTYYGDLEGKVDQEAMDFITDLTYDSMYKHTYSARASGLGIAEKIKKVMKLNFPRTTYHIPILIADGSKYDDLIESLRDEFDLDDTPVPVLKGFMIEWSRKENVSISPGIMGEVVNLAHYYQYKEGGDDDDPKPKGRKGKREEKQRLMEFTHRMIMEGVSYRKIGTILQCDWKTNYDNYKKWLAKNLKQDREFSSVEV